MELINEYETAKKEFYVFHNEIAHKDVDVARRIISLKYNGIEKFQELYETARLKMINAEHKLAIAWRQTNASSGDVLLDAHTMIELWYKTHPQESAVQPYEMNPIV